METTTTMIDVSNTETPRAHENIEEIVIAVEEQIGCSNDEDTENSEGIEENANRIMEYFDKNTLEEGECEEFVIQSLDFLDGVNIRTILEIYFENDDDKYKFYKFSLRIHESRYRTVLYDDVLHCSDELNCAELKKMLIFIIEKFETLRYCKMRNEFSTNKYIMLCEGKYLNPAKVNDCCVCHDKTICVTNCRHFICIQCASHIDNRLCPLCRACIHF